MTKLPRAQLFLSAVLVTATASAQTQTTYSETVLHDFTAFFAPNGERPLAGLIRDPSGNLYGTTYAGGAWGQGTVFKLDTAGRQTVLHSFRGGADGANPLAGVIRDQAGNIYGTTGLINCIGCDPTSYGVVYKLDVMGAQTVLYTFTGGDDGDFPAGAMAQDSAGNLYGTTFYGGKSGLGVVFKLDTSGHETVLHNFTGGADGAFPNGVLLDSGELYGTASCGGTGSACPGGGTSGYGLVYKLSLDGHETVLYTFTGGADGSRPQAGVIRDTAGNLYGTTSLGGTANAGVVFQLNPPGQETVLYNFTGGADGGSPLAGLWRDAAGNLYGTTSTGGQTVYLGGCGVIFKLNPAGQETVLHAFTETDGEEPEAGLIADAAGNLYGTTYRGGAAGIGVIYKLDVSGQESVYSLPGRSDGDNPVGGVVLDGAGNLYGTTSFGGLQNAGAGAGVVFKLNPAGQETLLHIFSGGTDGAEPTAGAALDSKGNLFGTTYGGGTANDGVVYILDRSGRETLLHTFTGGTDGANPTAGVILDPAGNLYGTTTYGGTANKGVVFKLDTAGNETILHTFTGETDGEYPEGSVAFDSAGNLYGTTTSGVVFKLDTTGNFTVLYTFTCGAGDLESGVVVDSAGNLYGTAYRGGRGSCRRYYTCGTIYKLSPSGQETTLHAFTGGDDGGSPLAGLILDSAGNLYGTTQVGGTAGFGVVFKVDPLGNETVLHSFLGPPDGNAPYAGVTMDSAGNLYGTTYKGGKQTEGTVFKLAPQ